VLEPLLAQPASSRYRNGSGDQTRSHRTTFTSFCTVSKTIYTVPSEAAPIAPGCGPVGPFLSVAIVNTGGSTVGVHSRETDLVSVNEIVEPDYSRLCVVRQQIPGNGIMRDQDLFRRVAWIVWIYLEDCRRRAMIGDEQIVGIREDIERRTADCEAKGAETLPPLSSNSWLFALSTTHTSCAGSVSTATPLSVVTPSGNAAGAFPNTNSASWVPEVYQSALLVES